MKYELVNKETGKVFFDDDSNCEMIVNEKDLSWLVQAAYQMNGNKDHGKYFVRRQN